MVFISQDDYACFMIEKFSLGLWSHSGAFEGMIRINFQDADNWLYRVWHLSMRLSFIVGGCMIKPLDIDCIRSIDFTKLAPKAPLVIRKVCNADFDS